MHKKITAQGQKGRQSYTVTLPKEWVTEQNIDKTMTVDMQVTGDKVTVSPTQATGQQVVLKVDAYEQSLMKVIPSLYRMGVQQIVCLISKPEQMENVSQICGGLIGFEVVDQTKQKMVLQEITRESEENFKTILRRIFLLLLEMTESQHEQEVLVLNKNCKRLINYCQRLIVKRGYEEVTKTPFYFLLLDQLEKIGDEVRWLFLSQEKLPLKKEVFQLLRAGYRLFYQFESKTYGEAVLRTYELKHLLLKRKTQSNGAMHLHNIVRLTNSLYGNVFVLAQAHTVDHFK
ncbi:hypothetical protein HZB02_00605 [Candidatus Woesearchaeota archaeon]|nr:hypothetical protein [Candidatus Woesearchaeota archaeon]